MNFRQRLSENSRMRLHRSLTSHRKVPFRPVLTFVYPSKPTVGALLLPFSDSLCRKLSFRGLRLSEARMRKGSPLFVRETEPGSVSNIVTLTSLLFGVRVEVVVRAERGSRRWMYARLLPASRSAFRAGAPAAAVARLGAHRATVAGAARSAKVLGRARSGCWLRSPELAPYS